MPSCRGGQGASPNHTYVVFVFFWVSLLYGPYLEKVLEQEDELGEPLNGFDHQSKEVQTVGSCDLLHLQKVGKSGLSFRFRLGKLHRLVEVVDEVRVDLQHRRLGEGRHENVPNSFLLEISSFISEHLLSCLYLDTLKLLHNWQGGASDMIQEEPITQRRQNAYNSCASNNTTALFICPRHVMLFISLYNTTSILSKKISPFRSLFYVLPTKQYHLHP